MSLTATDLAVLCALHDYGMMSEPDLSNEVPGALDRLLRLSEMGYIESRTAGESQAAKPPRWALTDKGLDLVEGEA